MSYFEALEDAARLGTADSVVRIKTAAATLREQYGSTGYAARGAGGGPGPADPEGYGRARAARMAGRPEQEPVHAIRRAPAPGGSAADQKQYDAALTQLNSPPPAFAALFADRRGDILAAQGKRDEARAAWQSAIDGLGTANPLTQVVQLKLDALSGA